MGRVRSAAWAWSRNAAQAWDNSSSVSPASRSSNRVSICTCRSSAHSASGRGRASWSARTPRRSTNPTNRPSNCPRAPSSASSGQCSPSNGALSPASCGGAAKPRSNRSSPWRQVKADSSGRPRRARWLPSRPQRTPASRSQSRNSGSSSLSIPARRAMAGCSSQARISSPAKRLWASSSNSRKASISGTSARRLRSARL